MTLAAEWIADDAALHEAAGHWRAAECLFMDTEFIRETTFYAIPALIQISDGQRHWLLDPVPVCDWSPLAAVLADAGTLKLFHACQEDVELLARLCGVAPQAVIDTQLAACFAGLGWSLGYNRLVEAVCGEFVEDAPHLTRSNWLARPLSAEQVQYAVTDVVHLAQAWDLLHSRLQARGWLKACREESAARVAQALAVSDPETLWPRLAGIERLSPRQRCVARRLCLWREQTARRDDVARNRLLRDSTLMEAARLQPRRLAELSALPELRSGMLRRYGEDLLAAIAAAADDPLTLIELPEPLPVTVMKTYLSLLKAEVSRVAAELQLPEALLASRAMLVALVTAWAAQAPLPTWLHGWRRDCLGQALLDCLERHRDHIDTL